MTSVGEINKALAPFIPLVKEIMGKDITLERTEALMRALGNPEKRLKVIHVAGTSGKTSTSYYIANLLALAGCKTGLTVSPHVDSVLERIQVDGQSLAAGTFLAALEMVIKTLQQAGLRPTYFELLMALAYDYFADTGVDYAVIETGMGGLHDASNVAQRADKVCVITDIGLDHTHILGRILPEIARQKAGIIHPNNTVFMHKQPEAVMQVIKKTCHEKSANLHIAKNNTSKGLTFEKLPEFQRRNFLLAYEVFRFLKERDGLRDANIADALKIQVPGRMESVRVGTKTIIMDGAHNEQKMAALVSSFRQIYPGRQVPVMLSLKAGKEATDVLKLLRPVTSTLIVTAFKTSQDLPTQSMEPGVLAAVAKQLGFEDIIVQPDQQIAYQKLLEQTKEVAVITGSFYLLSQLRSSFREL